MPEGAGVVAALQGDNVADGAVVDAGEGLAHAAVVAPAQAGDDGQPPPARFLTRGQHPANARRIDSHRLLAKDMLVGPDRGIQMSRPKMRRRAQEHHIDTAANHFSICIEADKLPFTGHVNLGGEHPVAAQFRQAAVEPITEGIAHGGQPDIRIGLEGIGRRPGAAAAAADEADAKDIVAVCVDSRGERQGCRRSG